MQTNTDVTNHDAHFRNLVDNALTGILDDTLEGKILFVNQALARMLEFESPEQMQAEGTLLRWCDPEDRKAFISSLKQQGYVNNYEADVFSKTGKHIRVLLSARFQDDVISSMVVDITDRKKKERALQKSEKRFRDIAVNALMWIWEVDGNGKYTYASPTVEKILGYKPEELLQKHFYDLFCPDDREELKQAAFDAFSGKERFIEFINRNVHKNGKVVWMSTSGIPIFDENGEFVGYRGADINITKRKLAEEKLQKSERKYRMLLENLPQKIFLKDTHSAYISCNENYAHDLGILPEEIVGKTDYDFFPRGLADKYRGDDKRILESGQADRLEEQYIQVGKKTWITTTKTPVRDDKGTVMGILGTFLDITEQKQVEEKLQDYQQRLRALASELTLTEERERRNIALDLHDQVGQSLAIMRMQLAVAQKESGGRKVAAILDEVSGSLRTAIQDTRHVISDLSSPLINELGLAAALSEWLTERIGERYGLETQFIDDGDPKPLGEDTEVILFRSVRELLTNVVKHANANRVSVSLQRRGSAIQIVVEDDGVGLIDGKPPGKNTVESGFGLFSIEERMSDLGGSLEIESHPGQGVRAILTAPLESDQAND